MINATRSFAHSISVFAARAVCAKRPSFSTRAMSAAQACALAALLAAPMVAVASQANVDSFVIFTNESNLLTVPSGVTQIHVIAIGGGGGGANGHQGGGGSGFVSEGTFNVTPGLQISVSVGRGGNGGLTSIGNNDITGLTSGTDSRFGNFLIANGGGIVTGQWNGGSGGGGGCNPGSSGGSGGSAGNYGSGCSNTPGTGQGASFVSTFNSFIHNQLTPGFGGAGGRSSHSGGGGGGGILMNGLGPKASDGIQSFSGLGGYGYGAGGGAGGYDQSSSTRWAGGNGANGMVYVEYEFDCNNNGIADNIDVRDYGALDQNADKIPDACQGIDQFNITTANLGVPTANTAYSNTFTNLYPTYTDATLTIRVKGDLDSANEFFTVKLNDITYARIFDNTNSTGINCTNATNGGVSTVTLTIPKATFAQYATAGELKITLLASPYVTAGECADGSTTMQLQFQGLTPGADCNSDTVWDLAEIYSNAALDRDLNRQLDACQIRDNPLLDRNNNGELDTYDISVNSALDCDGNKFIDTYEILDTPGLDCDSNGTLDFCDTANAGGVVLWGNNDSGQCNSPAAANSGPTAIACGIIHTVAIKNGSVFSWGNNGDGQCNIPATAFSDVAAIAGGYGHTTALKNGAVLAWGSNGNGQCNIPSNAQSGVTAIGCGDEHSIAMKNGAVMAWGYNYFGQCNIPDSALSDVAAIAGGAYHTIALKYGTVLAWGYNSDGQCKGTDGSGNPITNFSAIGNVPVQINGVTLTGITAIVGGTYHTIALKDGAVLAWGYNGYGQCNIPAAAQSGVSAIAGGRYHTIALKGGAVLAWGNNGNGQCTIPDAANSGITAIAGGGYHTIAIRENKDFNNNHRPDTCDILDNPVLDRNSNGVLDVYDILLNPSLDCDGNMFIDQYEIVDDAALDCNRNGRIDTCDLAEGVADCNLNGIPDSCDMEADASLDCDANGIIDTCDVGAGAIDDDSDGRPDACEMAKGDLDLDGFVDSKDLGILLLYWMEIDPPFGDFNNDQIINSSDLGAMLGNFGRVTWGESAPVTEHANKPRDKQMR